MHVQFPYPWTLWIHSSINLLKKNIVRIDLLTNFKMHLQTWTYLWHFSYCEHLSAHPNWLWIFWNVPIALEISDGWQGKGSDIQKSLTTKAIDLTETIKRHSLVNNLNSIFECLIYFKNTSLLQASGNHLWFLRIYM